MRSIRLRKALLHSAAATASLYSLWASAALPKPEAPSRGDSGSILKMFQDYGYDIAVLAGLVIATIAFIAVAIVCIGKFQEVSNKKATWSEFFTFMGVGAVILMLVIWLASQAAEIL